jgi:phenylacetate-CoA ligase
MIYFDPVIETMSREQLRSLQLEKLRALLDQIYGRNRFYTAKLSAAGFAPGALRSLDDLARLPFTTKSELVQAQADAPPFGANATFPESAYTRLHQTSGTTGMPLRVVDTRESWDWWGRCWGFVLSGAGLTADDRIFLPFSFGPFIGFWAAVEGAKHIGALMIPGGGRDSIQRLQIMRELGVTAMCCTPTYALRLAEVAREENFDLRDIPMRATIHAGEPGANVPATKARIEAEWHAKCFDHAGASEIGAHSFECAAQPGGVHVIESEFIVEVLEPMADKPAPPGEIGELVITNLGRPGFPAIRYRSGDLVRLNMEPCACGRTFARFEGGVLGRADDMVVVRGVNVFPRAIENLIREFEAIDEFRVTIATRHAMRELQIEIEVADGVDAEAIRSGIERSVHYALALHPMVTLAERGSLPRYELKARRFRIEH